MNSMNGSTGYRGATGNNSGRSSGGMSGGGFNDKIPKGFKSGQMQQFTPEQMQLFQQMLESLGGEGYLSRLSGGDESLFNEMEAPALRQFNELQGGLASRFSGMGMGARKSSGFQNTSSAAASNFAQELQANRQNLQRQATQDLFGMRESLLNQRPYERFMTEKPQKEKSPWGSVVGGVVGGVGGAFFGNPVLGAQVGAAAGSYF